MRATALLAAVCCLTPALAAAQDHRGIIDMQFEKAASAVAEQGFVPSTGVLPQQTAVGLLPAVRLRLLGHGPRGVLRCGRRTRV